MRERWLVQSQTGSLFAYLEQFKRLLILGLLAEQDQPLYGQEIAERLGVTPQTNKPHHLHILKNSGTGP